MTTPRKRTRRRAAPPALEDLGTRALVAEARRLGVSDAETPKGEDGTVDAGALLRVVRRCRGEGRSR